MPASSIVKWIAVIHHLGHFHYKHKCNRNRRAAFIDFKWSMLSILMANLDNLMIAVEFVGEAFLPKQDPEWTAQSQTLNVDEYQSPQTSNKASKGRNKASCVMVHYIVSLKKTSPVANLFYAIMRKKEIEREMVRKESERERGRVNVEKMRGGGGGGKVINFLLKGWLLVWFNSSESGWFLRGKLQPAKAWLLQRQAPSHTHAYM